VVVDTVRCSYVTAAPDAMRTQATTVLAWISKPAQRGDRTSISRLPFERHRRGVLGGET
jgi:hypothetical protein